MSSRTAKETTVIIPALNEENNIGFTLSEILELADVGDIIVVDGGSVDGTAEIAEKSGARVLIQRNVGKGDAMFQGIQQLQPNAKYVVFTDADYTYPAEFIPKMVSVLMENKDVGMVIGSRFEGKKIGKSLTNRMIAAFQYLINGIELNDPLSGLRVVRTELLREWKPKSKGFDIEIEINSIINRKGYRIVEIPIDYRARLGEKKLRVRYGLSILRKIISQRFKG